MRRSAAPFSASNMPRDRKAATRAVLEGVTFALKDCQEALAATGTSLTA
jgi:sugar (pentulose or hexulose) kinase